jgi:catechol 2,3-dioxygenase-like lactoylglutathione lyase family enzyme
MLSPTKRLLILLVAVTLAAGAVAEEEPYVKIKRPNLVVPDLDAAIHFYRDILGFKFLGASESKVNPESYSYPIFGIDPDKPYRSAMFSTSTEERGLGLTEIKGMEVKVPDHPRAAVLVVETKRIRELEKKLREEGFKVVDPVEAGGAGGRFIEMGVIDPAGHMIVLFQYIP